MVEKPLQKPPCLSVLTLFLSKNFVRLAWTTFSIILPGMGSKETGLKLPIKFITSFEKRHYCCFFPPFHEKTVSNDMLNMKTSCGTNTGNESLKILAEMTLNPEDLLVFMSLQVEMINSCNFKMVSWFYYCIYIFKIIYLLLNSLSMVRALIEICTSAPYRPGHKLLSDITPEPRGGWHTYPLALRGHSALQVLSPFSSCPLR